MAALVPEQTIGSNLNEWRPPVSDFNASEKRDFQSKRFINTFDISGQLWQKATTAMDQALNKIYRQMLQITRNKYPEITIENTFVKQGSSREGLKVAQPDEFDCLIEFRIKDLRYHRVPVMTNENIPGHFYMEVEHSEEDLKSRFPNLFREDVFSRYHGYSYVIDTENLQTKVFTSIIDATVSSVTAEMRGWSGSDKYIIKKQKVIPPTLCIKIEIDHDGNDEPFSTMADNLIRLESATWPRFKKEIEIDMVPAIVLDTDRVPDPYTVRQPRVQYMDCHRYAVAKWIHKKVNADLYPNVDTSAVWRESTCGYEKHIFDVCRRNVSQRYLMTALRVLKAYRRDLETRSPQNQLLKVVTTYRLKNLCIHGLLLLTIPSRDKTLSGVKGALGYILGFLQICLERRYMPHFFYGNAFLLQMFPESFHILEAGGKLDLFSDVVRDTLSQASSSFKQLLSDLNRIYIDRRQLDQTVFEQFQELFE